LVLGAHDPAGGGARAAAHLAYPDPGKAGPSPRPRGHWGSI